MLEEGIPDLQQQNHEVDKSQNLQMIPAEIFDLKVRFLKHIHTYYGDYTRPPDYVFTLVPLKIFRSAS